MRFKLPIDVEYVLEKLNENYEAYIVGGCVRDLLLGIKPNDYDICTSATPKEVEEVFTDNRIIETGLQHGTVTIMMNGIGYEITTYRIDGEYSDNRRPDSIKFTTDLVKDLERRDFTINAMAYNHKDGLVDPFSGYRDLKNRLIRCVGNAENRFSEDALRILRAMRFSIRYGFEIEIMTSLYMDILRVNLLNISKERITSEFEKMLSCGKQVKLVFYKYYKIITTIIPELDICFGFNQHNRYHRHDVYSHMLFVTDYCDTNDFVIKLAAMLHDIGKPETYTVGDDGYGHFYGHPEVSYEICKEVLSKSFRLSNEQYDEIRLLVRYHDMDLATTKKSVKRALNKLGESTLRKWLILKLADRKDHIGFSEQEICDDLNKIEDILNEIIEHHDCFSLKDLAVNGSDLIEIGYKPGKVLGDTLNSLLQMVIDGESNNKERLLKVANEMIKS